GMSTTHAAVRAVFVISMRAPAGVAFTSPPFIIAEDLIYLLSPIVTMNYVPRASGRAHSSGVDWPRFSMGELGGDGRPLNPTCWSDSVVGPRGRTRGSAPSRLLKEPA